MPELFQIFAGFFKVTLPGRTNKVPVASVNNERRFASRELKLCPGRSHCHAMGALVSELHRVQVRQAGLTARLYFYFCAPG